MFSDVECACVFLNELNGMVRIKICEYKCCRWIEKLNKELDFVEEENERNEK